MTLPSRAVLALLAGSAFCALVFVWAVTAVDPVFAANEAGNAAFAVGEHRAAIDRYREVEIARHGIGEPVVNAANAWHRLTEHARALAEYDRAIGLSAGEVKANAYYGRGNTLFRQGQFEAARGAYVDALRLAPGDGDAKYNVEVIDRLLAVQAPGDQPPGDGQGGSPRPGQSGQPGQSGRPGEPGQSGQPGQSQPQGPGQPGSRQPPQTSGPPRDSSTPGDPATPDVDSALREFRETLSIEEALVLLEALRGEARGVEGLLEGIPFRRQPSDPTY